MAAEPANPYMVREREARRILSLNLQRIQQKALCPEGKDPDVCICGDQECNGLCETTIWAVRVLLEALVEMDIKEKDFIDELRDLFRG